MYILLQVQHLCLYGGPNIKTTVRRLLNETLTSAVAERFNFLGKKGKRAFSMLKLNSILFSKSQ